MPQDTDSHTLLGFDWRLGRHVQRSRRAWAQALGEIITAGGEVCLSAAGTYAQDAHKMALLEIYSAVIPAGKYLIVKSEIDEARVLAQTAGR